MAMNSCGDLYGVPDRGQHLAKSCQELGRWPGRRGLANARAVG